MKILIDGDSCHVLRQTERVARRSGIPCHVYCDTHRTITSNYSEVHVVDAGPDSADFAIVNSCEPGDIVVTADGGLAAMAMARRACAISPYTGEYTDRNIMQVLTNRHARAHAAQCGTKYRPQAVQPARRESFRTALTRIIMERT